MFFIFLTGLFIWLAFRKLELSHPEYSMESKRYIAIMLVLALLSAWFPFQSWRAERLIIKYGALISEVEPIDAICKSKIEIIFSNLYLPLVAGLANIQDRQIIIDAKYCDLFLDYLDDPENADHDEIFSLHVLIHEAMHIRGEWNEQKTDCQAIQRAYRAAKLMGIPDHLAKQHSIYIYSKIYPNHPYFSPDCAPGKSMDEKLPDSTWNWLSEE